MNRRKWLGAALASVALATSRANAQDMIKIKAGMVGVIDQIGLPIALERGFFEKEWP